jgi:drug/metabolite transporter (DMT)-like permease
MTEVPKPFRLYLFFRCAFGFIVVTCMFSAIYMLPYSLAMILIFTSPIATVIVNFALAGERLKLLEYVSIVFAMFGVVLMTNPGLLGIEFEEVDHKAYPNYTLGVVSGLACSIS